MRYTAVLWMLFKLCIYIQSYLDIYNILLKSLIHISGLPLLLKVTLYGINYINIRVFVHIYAVIQKVPHFGWVRTLGYLFYQNYFDYILVLSCNFNVFVCVSTRSIHSYKLSNFSNRDSLRSSYGILQ